MCTFSFHEHKLSYKQHTERTLQLLNTATERHEQSLPAVILQCLVYLPLTARPDRRPPGMEKLVGCLRMDTAVATKLAFKLVKTNAQCSTVHEKFLIVLEVSCCCLVTTISTDPLASKRNAELVATLKQKLGKLVTTVSPLNVLATC